MFIEAFSKLPQRFIMKIADTSLEFPKNVKAYKWVPQQDVLGKKILTSYTLRNIETRFLFFLIQCIIALGSYGKHHADSAHSAS